MPQRSDARLSLARRILRERQKYTRKQYPKFIRWCERELGISKDYAQRLLAVARDRRPDIRLDEVRFATAQRNRRYRARLRELIEIGRQATAVPGRKKK